MKFLFASDSLKGTLSSARTAEILAEEAKKVFPGCECAGVAVADGGEGTVDAAVKALGGQLRTVRVHDPLMDAVDAVYGVVDGGSAVIEMAAASGLPLIPEEKRNPLHTTSYGTGELIRDALDQGCRQVAVAVGGSATNDGGLGAMAALGVRFYDEAGRILTGFGEELVKVARIDASGLHPAVRDTEFTVMCDVTNPLTGPEGATYTFGRQKGGTTEILDRLECGMRAYAAKLCELCGEDVDGMPGAGAAGGLGAALHVFLHADMKSGIETVLDLIGFDSLLEGVDFVVTGEGCMDRQSTFGKVPAGVGLRCKRKGIPVVAIVGSMGEGAGELFNFGIDSIIPAVNGAMTVEEAMDRAEELYRGAAERMFRMLRSGMRLAISKF